MYDYLLTNYLSGVNSTTSTNPLSSLYSTGTSSSNLSSIESTLSFLEIMQGLQSSSSMDDIFNKAASRYDVDASLLKAIAKAESGFDADAVSQAGAVGVMQLMPATARSLGVTDPYDAEQNIMGGAKYISQMLQRYDGDVKLALAAYNAGPGNVDKYGGVPPFTETQNYVEKVTGYLEDGSVVVSGATASSLGNNAADNPVSTQSFDVLDSATSIGFQTDKEMLSTIYTLLRTQMELQLASNMFAWNTDDSNS